METTPTMNRARMYHAAHTALDEAINVLEDRVIDDMVARFSLEGAAAQCTLVASMVLEEVEAKPAEYQARLQADGHRLEEF